MKRLLLFFLFSGIFGISLFGQYVSIEGRQFKDENGDDFYPLVCNYCLDLPYTLDANGNYHFVIAPHHHYGESWRDEYTPMDSAITRIYSDFREIKNMGFNTIRLMRILQKNLDTTKNAPQKGYLNGFYTFDNQYIHSGWPTLIWHQYHFDRPYSTNSELSTLLDQYQQVLQKAKDAGLYVIIVPAAGYDLFLNQTEVDDFDSLLLVFCKRLKNSSNLLAYDLYNEPFFVDIFDHKKEEVCSWTNQLYSSIHTVDSNHLITIGGGFPYDIMEWDPSILKIDFWSPHFYPPSNYRMPVPFNIQIEKVNNNLVWLMNSCPIPWIIGETGYVADDDDSIQHVWGTEIQQAAYADTTLKMVRNAGGSGYSWWMFQEVFWYGTPGVPPLSLVHNHQYGTDDYYMDVTRYDQNNFGLLDSGDPVNCNGSGANCDYSALEKPAVDIFQSYLTSANYLNPGLPPVPINYGATGNNPNHPNKITGRIVDQNTIPIKDAYIQGNNTLKRLKLDNSETTLITDDFIIPYPLVYNSQGTYTDCAGQFTLIPYDYLPPIDDSLEVNQSEVLKSLKISCNGCEGYYVNWPSNNPLIPLHHRTLVGNLGDIVVQRRSPLEFENVINNRTIYFAPPPVNYSAWNKLTLNNITILGNGVQGGISDITARTEIQVNHEFDAQRGSEVHIFLSETALPCSSLSPFKDGIQEVSPSTMNQTDFNKMEIELSFLQERAGLSVFPNPTSGGVRLEIQNTNSSFFKVLITNMYGSTMNQFTCQKQCKFDMSNFAKGIYTLTVYADNEVIGTEKVILY